MYSHPSKQGTYYSKPWNMDGFPPKKRGTNDKIWRRSDMGPWLPVEVEVFFTQIFDAAASLERNYYVKLMANHCLGLVVRSCPGEERWWNKKWDVDKPCKKKTSSIFVQYISHNSNEQIKGLKWQKREKWLKTAIATCCGMSGWDFELFPVLSMWLLDLYIPTLTLGKT